MIRSNYKQLQPAQSPPVSPKPKPESINLLVRVLYMMNFDARAHFMTQSPRIDLISLESPFIAEPKAGEVTAPEAGDRDEDQDFTVVWDAATAFSARGWCDGTLDAVVRRLQGLGFPRGLSVLPADQPPFEGRVPYWHIKSPWIGSNWHRNCRRSEGLDPRRPGWSWTSSIEIARESRQRRGRLFMAYAE